MSKCPVCDSLLQAPSQKAGDTSLLFDCIRCGKFTIPEQISGNLISGIKAHEDPDFIHKLSYFIRKKQNRKAIPPVSYKEIDYVEKNISLPRLDEIIDMVMLYLGNKLNSFSKMRDILYDQEIANFGCRSFDEVDYIISHIVNLKFLKPTGKLVPPGGMQVQITFKGWEYYRKLKAGESASKNGFMAMKFGGKAEEYFKKNIRPAVQAAGFDIHILPDNAKAGNIDNQMRDEIRKSKFLLADLSDANNGAYWEAGFAEGLGKPVIYLCEKGKLDNIHFDTNHHTTVKLDFSDWLKTEKELTATLRNTFPEESYGE